jgi:hypothetical protein
MRGVLKWSVLANLVLAAVVVYFARNHWPAKEIAAGGRPIAWPENQAKSPEPKFGSFTWRQIESSDYRAYIANIRSIGCPEQTIRDIIVADVHGLYAPQYEQLKQIEKVVEESVPDARAIMQQACAAELQIARDQEAAVISALLGGEPERLTPKRLPVCLPLALRDPSPLRLDASQSAVMRALREEFLREIADSQSIQDYCHRWQAAQHDSDDLFAGTLGGQFFVEYQQAVTQ